mmetsp:Transcript_31859/g.44159  ORF Transcript_31859/g.44159 Transcript_31859/m.44159 type:complete len:308 (-) Transcript_31859:4-927(-)|eukprot:CAMPEP_0196581166 /NCGR_PEP_ID=MMETSP1081-20130531/32743_1 /TAXON_ID=36882 /ORGANISM="Pyramimonas amylifera, Strain CCMP720" /LENGTH=307 /DNA_ID=CAMNT_0041901287 /DNA_START=141 /DNA_END=1064 /DNA_ORIENTATION=-
MSDPINSGQLQERRQTQQESVLVPLAKKLLAPTPKKVAGLSAYILGIFLCCFFVPPTVPPEKLAEYSSLMKEANSVPGYSDAEIEVQHARYALQDVEVFFWRWREPYKWLVPQRRADLHAAQKSLSHLQNERKHLVVKAKQSVGLFSSFAVDEVKQLFWNSVEQGKIFARRQTFWSGLMIVMESRDGNLFSFLLEWALALVVNFTVGLVGALVAFLWYLKSIVTSYNPDPVSGVLFWSGCVLAGVSMILTYLVGLYGAFGTAIYATASLASNRMRLEGGRRQQQQRQYIRQQGFVPPRPGYDRRHYD